MVSIKAFWTGLMGGYIGKVSQFAKGKKENQGRPALA
jgi:hypothetical protein